MRVYLKRNVNDKFMFDLIWEDDCHRTWVGATLHQDSCFDMLGGQFDPQTEDEVDIVFMRKENTNE